jgi:L-serine deaminase
MILVGGCASANVVPLAQDTIQITSAAAPVCGMTGAQNVASQRAAVETIRRGYDKYMIVGGQYQNNVGVVGYTPVTASTTGSATAYGNRNYATAYGHSTTTYSGGQPIIAGSHNQGLVVKMFKAGDPAAETNALDARAELGPEWQKKVSSNLLTCIP